jgi:hypothetical protein
MRANPNSYDNFVTLGTFAADPESMAVPTPDKQQPKARNQNLDKIDVYVNVKSKKSTRPGDLG